jgi:hypothetical protein
MTGEKSVSSTIPIDPPMNDATVVISKATPALPCRAIG